MNARSVPRWCWPVLVFGIVLIAQLFLVRAAGTDIPFYDQWDVEGRWLYPAWRDGTLHFAQLFQPYNEHRIVWTHALNLGLFAADGQWDPLVQMFAGALIRALAAAVLADALLVSLAGWRRVAVGFGVAVAFLPQLAWHNALWGFQSQVYFALLFSLLALRWLTPAEPRWRLSVAGMGAGIAALLAMAAGAFVPVAVIALVLIRGIENRRWARRDVLAAVPALFLLAIAFWLRVDVPEHAGLRAHSVGAFVHALGEVLAWPHVTMPVAALVLNAPVAIAVLSRLLRRRQAVPGEDFAVAMAAWGFANALATAWARGGSDEFAFGVPARYVDFVVLLPIANAWLALALVRSVPDLRRRVTGFIGAGWLAFLLVGYVGLSAEMMRHIIIPRVEDRDAPVRLAVAFQHSGDPAVFAGQPRLLVPHPNPESVRIVLSDPRMRGALPPSFQPDRPMGPLSRAVRWVLGRR